MILLFTYVLIALVFSFLCSIAEAVLLSVTSAHIALMESENKPSAPVLKTLKEDIKKPLAAILTLNTIAHTIGAAGAGAQAAVVFGNAYVALASAVLTLLILIFSEIIPKTLGAHYWRSLAPATAYGLKFLVWLLYPFVKLSEKLTSGMVEEPALNGFSRAEFSAMADLSVEEGRLNKQESSILKNLLLLNEIRVKEVMTPRTVIFSLSEHSTVENYFHQYDDVRFSRIPIYSDGDQEQIVGFVLRSDLLLAQSRGNTTTTLKNYCREIQAILDSTKVAQALEECIRLKSHIMLIVDEYGGIGGIVTLEDLLETMLGREIVDESDKTVDMQQLALKLARRQSLVKKRLE
jgi:CBS domain containing-hemolysin-like protein